jgi:hypothetical protein
MIDSALLTMPSSAPPNAHDSPRILAVDAVLFDLDGTLADTAPDLIAALNRVRADHGRDPLPLADLRGYASHGARGMLGAGMEVRRDTFPALRDAFLDHWLRRTFTRSLCGVATLLDARETRFNGASSPAGQRVSRAVARRVATFHARPMRLLRRYDATYQAASCATLFARTAGRYRPLRVCWGYRATSLPAQQRECDDHCRYSYIEALRPRDWPAAGMIDDPSALLHWLYAGHAPALRNSHSRGCPSRVPVTCTGWLAINGRTTAVTMSSMLTSAIPFDCDTRSPDFMPSMAARPVSSRTTSASPVDASNPDQVSGLPPSLRTARR